MFDSVNASGGFYATQMGYIAGSASFTPVVMALHYLGADSYGHKPDLSSVVRITFIPQTIIHVDDIRLSPN